MDLWTDMGCTAFVNGKQENLEEFLLTLYHRLLLQISDEVSEDLEFTGMATIKGGKIEACRIPPPHFILEHYRKRQGCRL